MGKAMYFLSPLKTDIVEFTRVYGGGGASTLAPPLDLCQ